MAERRQPAVARCQALDRLGAKQPLDVLAVEPDEGPEGAVGSEATVGHEHVDMRMEIEQLSRGLDKPNGSRGDVGAVEVGLEVESESSPGAAGELAQQTEMFGWPLILFVLAPLVEIPRIAPGYFDALGHWPARMSAAR